MKKIELLINQSVEDVREYVNKGLVFQTQISDLTEYLVNNFEESECYKHFETFISKFTKQERDQLEKELRESFEGHYNLFY